MQGTENPQNEVQFLEDPHKRREFSSVGSERLPYKQEVDGSNPSTPTKFFSYV